MHHEEPFGVKTFWFYTPTRRDLRFVSIAGVIAGVVAGIAIRVAVAGVIAGFLGVSLLIGFGSRQGRRNGFKIGALCFHPVCKFDDAAKRHDDRPDEERDRNHAPLLRADELTEK